VTVIFNRGSGSQKGHEPIVELLKKCEVDAHLVPTTGPEVCKAAEEAARSDDDLIVAAGGDGTIGAVCSALVGTGKTLGVIPSGTFNFFARKLKIPLDQEEAIKVLTNGRTIDVDVGEVNGRVFINNSSIGLYPAALREREQAYRKFGRKRIIAYVAGAIALLRQRRNVMKLRLSADGDEQALKSQFVFVCNNQDQLDFYNIRGGECVANGSLAVYTAPPLTPMQIVRLGLHMLVRRLDKTDDYQAQCARDLWIETRRPKVEVALDGERMTLTSPLHFRMHTAALRVRVPHEG
jgi:diacylglycerol kinase family enzyme